MSLVVLFSRREIIRSKGDGVPLSGRKRLADGVERRQVGPDLPYTTRLLSLAKVGAERELGVLVLGQRWDRDVGRDPETGLEGGHGNGDG